MQAAASALALKASNLRKRIEVRGIDLADVRRQAPQLVPPVRCVTDKGEALPIRASVARHAPVRVLPAHQDRLREAKFDLCARYRVETNENAILAQFLEEAFPEWLPSKLELRSYNSHLHTFTAGGVVYADPNPEWEIKVRNERRARLGGIAREEGEAFVYEYDMGDSWRHQVVVEELLVESEDVVRPLCLAGERACPPEDCGGVQGYYEKLECLRDPDHEEHEQTKTWIEGMTGGPFDPDVFDLEAVNRALQAFHHP